FHWVVGQGGLPDRGNLAALEQLWPQPFVRRGKDVGEGSQEALRRGTGSPAMGMVALEVVGKRRQSAAARRIPFHRRPVLCHDGQRVFPLANASGHAETDAWGPRRVVELQALDPF